MSTIKREMPALLSLTEATINTKKLKPGLEAKRAMGGGSDTLTYEVFKDGKRIGSVNKIRKALASPGEVWAATKGFSISPGKGFKTVEDAINSLD